MSWFVIADSFWSRCSFSFSLERLRHLSKLCSLSAGQKGSLIYICLVNQKARPKIFIILGANAFDWPRNLIKFSFILNRNNALSQMRINQFWSLFVRTLQGEHLQNFRPSNGVFGVFLFVVCFNYRNMFSFFHLTVLPDFVLVFCLLSIASSDQSREVVQLRIWSVKIFWFLQFLKFVQISIYR